MVRAIYLPTGGFSNQLGQAILSTKTKESHLWVRPFSFTYQNCMGLLTKSVSYPFEESGRVDSEGKEAERHMGFPARKTVNRPENIH